MLSPSTYEERRFEQLLADLVDLNIGVICCPSAAISMRQHRPVLAPTGNSIARVLEMAAALPPAWMAERLAGFKVPARMLFLDTLPRCAVGKVRRRELAEPCLREPLPDRAPPTTGLEAALARIWADELDVAEIGIDDDFAAAGGRPSSSTWISVPRT